MEIQLFKVYHVYVEDLEWRRVIVVSNILPSKAGYFWGKIWFFFILNKGL